ncbi:MAG: hypothetical protein AAF517_14940, partial [Planctomycetota bacterium]
MLLPRTEIRVDGAWLRCRDWFQEKAKDDESLVYFRFRNIDIETATTGIERILRLGEKVYSNTFWIDSRAVDSSCRGVRQNLRGIRRGAIAVYGVYYRITVKGVQLDINLTLERERLSTRRLDICGSWIYHTALPQSAPVRDRFVSLLNHGFELQHSIEAK